MRSRFRCPRCGAALTSWLRELELADALNLHMSHTWSLPSRWFVRRDSPLLRGSLLTEPASYPWLLAPSMKWLRIHADGARTIGCCGLAHYGPELPNLVCACGHEIGLGYRDCIGPYWFSLHASVVREEAVDAAPLQRLAERLTGLRARVAGPVARTGYDPGGRGAWHHDTTTWDDATRLNEVALDCGGGVDDPAITITSPQLPAGAQLVVPLPWCQLVRLVVLCEKPWAETSSPLRWQNGEQPRVSVSRHRRRVLLTAWGKGDASWAVTFEVRAWAGAWARLRG